jgi:hypothetical protein
MRAGVTEKTVTGRAAGYGRAPPGEKGRQSDKQFVIDELQKQGQSEHVQKALAELPAKVDHHRDAALLEKFGVDPGQLAEKAAQKGLASL